MSKVVATVGQEVAVKSGYDGFGSLYSFNFGYTVKKVTPGGQVIIVKDGGNERRFDNEGYEMGSFSSKYRRDTLVTDVEGARKLLAQRELCQTAAEKIRLVRVQESSANYGKEGLTCQIVTLQRLLDEAKAAVDLIS